MTLSDSDVTSDLVIGVEGQLVVLFHPFNVEILSGPRSKKERESYSVTRLLVVVCFNPVRRR